MKPPCDSLTSNWVPPYNNVVTCSVLIVDDSVFSRRGLRRLLEDAGHTVDEAQDGLEALEHFRSCNPDIVLLDLVMDKMTGVEVLETLRQMDADAKIIIATADVQIATRQRVKAAGANGIVLKPFNSQEVVETIAKVMCEGEAWN